MPTYDYHCDACDHEFEHFQTITSPVLKKCPQCGKNKLRRLLGTGAALVFKGSGFYSTDYRSESYKKAADKDKPSGDGKTDAKSSGETKKPDGGGSDKSPKTESKSKPAK